MKRSLRRLGFAAIPLVLAGAAGAQVASIGLSSVRAQRFGNDFSDILPPQPGDQFALALAVGDFDGDGADDLATGIPGDDGRPGSEVPDNGLVLVRHGADRGGLGPEIDLLRQVGSGVEPGDAFGLALASCDFDGDSFDDLAVGAPREDLGAIGDAGAVFVYHGSSGGLVGAVFQLVTQDTAGLPDAAESNDLFGFALACADFDADGFDDLVVGAPGEALGAAAAAGTLVVVRGSAAGLDPLASLAIHQDTSLVPDVAEAQDSFGLALVPGDWNGDGFDDLAVGVPGEDLSSGALHVFFGGPSGISTGGGLFFDENGTGGVSEEDDQFGMALAAGDFDGDGHDDLAVGIPLEDFGVGGSIVDCGQVNVFYGAFVGFDLGRTQFWAQDNILGAGTSETVDTFGRSMAAGDFDRDGRADLAIGAPREFVTGAGDGAATVLMGSIVGLGAERHRGLAAGFDGFPGDPDQHDRQFSRTLAAGDFDGDGHSDLAIGAPNEDEDFRVDVGAETILYGALFADGFETAAADLWSGSVP